VNEAEERQGERRHQGWPSGTWTQRSSPTANAPEGAQREEAVIELDGEVRRIKLDAHRWD
jgi:hypothetical protein